MSTGLDSDLPDSGLPFVTPYYLQVKFLSAFTAVIHQNRGYLRFPGSPDGILYRVTMDQCSMWRCVSVSRVNVYLYHVASSPTIIFAESGFVTRVRLSVWRPVTNGSSALGLPDQWGPELGDSCGPASGHGVEDELVVGCAGLVPASVPSMRVSVGSGGRVSEVSSDPVRGGRERGTHGPCSGATMGSVLWRD